MSCVRRKKTFNKNGKGRETRKNIATYRLKLPSRGQFSDNYLKKICQKFEICTKSAKSQQYTLKKKQLGKLWHRFNPSNTNFIQPLQYGLRCPKSFSQR